MQPTGHGYYQLHSHNSLLLAQLYDSWNVTTTKEYQAELQHVVGQYCHQPWAAIFDIRHWQFLTPESIPIMQQQISWCLQNQLSHCIYLSSNSGIFEYIKQQMHAHIGQHTCKFAQLSSVEESFATLQRWQVQIPKSISTILEN
ncbi:hypothetical protein ACVFI8_09555 [Agarivorans sp. MS3-6]